MSESQPLAADANEDSTARKGVFLAVVGANETICREHWRLVLEIEGFPPAAPGQFVQLLCAEPGHLGWTGGAFVRRPFSIGGLRRRDGRCEIDILYRMVGPGTYWLSQLSPGRQVSVLGPLGHPFELPTDRRTAYLVGGGIGLPPLIWLAQELHRAGTPAVAFVGSRTASLLPLTRIVDVTLSGDRPGLSISEFARSQTPCLVATDDGSLGAPGRVPEVFDRYLDHRPNEAASAMVYSCGPEPMLRAVAEICGRRDIPCYVCLERMMACGMGTCQSCVVRIRDKSDPDGWRYRLCCTDGPVFDARDVIWAD